MYLRACVSEEGNYNLKKAREEEKKCHALGQSHFFFGEQKVARFGRAGQDEGG
jgi:hypothetical protein